MKSLVLMVVVGWCWMTSLALSQPNGPYGTQGPPKIELEGKLQAWQGGMMRIVTSSGKPILFALRSHRMESDSLPTLNRAY